MTELTKVNLIAAATILCIIIFGFILASPRHREKSAFDKVESKSNLDILIDAEQRPVTYTDFYYKVIRVGNRSAFETRTNYCMVAFGPIAASKDSGDLVKYGRAAVDLCTIMSPSDVVHVRRTDNGWEVVED